MKIIRNDDQLVLALKNEEEWSFKAVYKSNYGMVANIVKKNSGSDRDAKDLFQDVIIALIKAINKPGFELNTNTKLSTFIHAIAYRLWMMKLKKDKKMSVKSVDNDFDFEFDDTLIAEKVEIEKKHELISKYFGSLDTECHKLLDLFYFKKVKLKEIAKQMDYTAGFVRVKKSRCINGLKKKVLSEYQGLIN